MGNKLKPYSKEWTKRAISLAVDYAPTIYPCDKCNAPVADGYCCGSCGTDDPGNCDDHDLMGNWHLIN